MYYFCAYRITSPFIYLLEHSLIKRKSNGDPFLHIVCIFQCLHRIRVKRKLNLFISRFGTNVPLYTAPITRPAIAPIRTNNVILYPLYVNSVYWVDSPFFINPWLLGVKCKYIITVTEGKDLHLMFHDTVSNFTLHQVI